MKTPKEIRDVVEMIAEPTLRLLMALGLTPAEGIVVMLGATAVISVAGRKPDIPKEQFAVHIAEGLRLAVLMYDTAPQEQSPSSDNISNIEADRLKQEIDQARPQDFNC